MLLFSIYLLARPESTRFVLRSRLRGKQLSDLWRGFEIDRLPSKEFYERRGDQGYKGGSGGCFGSGHCHGSLALLGLIRASPLDSISFDRLRTLHLVRCVYAGISSFLDPAVPGSLLIAGASEWEK